jgi:hypothetical protein
VAGGSTVFEWACGQLDMLTTMSRLQARGTLRLALGNAGCDIETLTGRQLRVVAMKLLAKELRARAIADADGVCTELMKIPAEVEAGAGLLHPTAADIFKRLGRKE